MVFFLFLLAIGMFIFLVTYIMRTEKLDDKTEALFAKITEIELQLNGLVKLIKGPPVVEKPPPIGEEPEPSEEVKVEEEEIFVRGIPPTEPTTQPIYVTPPPPSTPAETPAPSPVVAPVPERTLTIEEPVPHPVRPSRTREEWEALIGGKLLNRIGALALIIGIGFFLKYAFDKNWITETVRVMIGVLVGLILLVGGARFHKKEYQIFAQGLVGSGISILYLSVYASFNFYHLVPQVVAFLFMSAVTALTFSQAFKYNSLAVSFLGWTGGFLTPILLSTGQANEVGLFTYITLLDVGLLLVILKKDSWVILEPFTFAATYLMYLLWYLKFYTPADLSVTVFFLSIFWGLFYVVDLYRIVKLSYSFREVRQSTAAFNAIFYYAAMYKIVDPQHHDWMGLITIVIGAIYFLTILTVKRTRVEDKIVMARYVLTAIALLILATTIQFSGFTTVIFWSIEALILAWCGIHWNLRYVWQSALGLFGIALIKLMVTKGALGYIPIQKFSLLLNHRAFAFMILIAALGASTILFRRLEEKGSQRIWAILHYSWSLLLFGFCTIETIDYFRWLMLHPKFILRAHPDFARFMILAAVWAIYSLPMVWYGFRKKISPLFFCGIGALGLSIIFGTIRGILFEPIWTFAVLFNLRTVVLVLIIGGIWLHVRWLGGQRNDYLWADKVQIVFRYCWCILLLILCTVETNDYFRRLMMNITGGARANLEFNRFMAMVAVWTIYSLPMVWYGLRKKIPAIFYCGFGALGLSVLFGAVYGTSFKPIEGFVLLVNSRVEVLILIIAALLLHEEWLKNKGRGYSWTGKVQMALQYSWGILFFILCTVEANDYFRSSMVHTAGSLKISLEFTRFMTLALVWMAYSLVLAWYGLRKEVRPILYCSLGALGLSVFLGAVRGFRFEPIEEFILLTNLRALGLVFIVLGTFIHARWLRKSRPVYSWVNKALVVLQVIAVILIFELITGEIWDFFTRETVLLRYGAVHEINRLANLKQLSLSSAWLIYSILLMIIGIWRRIQRIRIMAIVLFGITILKIFIYDLSFLETLYRIFSFVGLGLILLATSYLYQRYRKIIFGSD